MVQKLIYESTLALPEFSVYDGRNRNDSQGPRFAENVAPFTTPGPKVPATIDVSDINIAPDGSYSYLTTLHPERAGAPQQGIRLSSGPASNPQKWASAGMVATRCPQFVPGMACEFEFAQSAIPAPGHAKGCIGMWGAKSWPPEVDLFETADATVQSMFITNHWPEPKSTPPRGQAQIPGIKGDFTKRTLFRWEFNASGMFYYVNGKQVGTHTQNLPTQPLVWFAQTACTDYPTLPTAPYHLDIFALRAYTL